MIGRFLNSVDFQIFCVSISCILGGGGGCNPKKPNPYLRKGQTGIGFYWFFLGFLNIAILAEKYAYFYFPFKSFELPQYIFVQSMTTLNIGLH